MKTSKVNYPMMCQAVTWIRNNVKTKDIAELIEKYDARSLYDLSYDIVLEFYNFHNQDTKDAS